MAQHLSPYEAGVQAGQSAVDLMSAVEMSHYVREFTMGYIVGYSSMESIKLASQYAGAYCAGELGFKYRISADELLAHLGFDDELTEWLREAYEGNPEKDEDFDLDGPG